MAVAASILTAIYHMLKDGTMYQDLGRKHFDRRSNDQQKRSLVKRLADLGYTVEVKPLTPKPYARHGRELVARSVRRSFFRVPHRRIADPRCMKLCYRVLASSAQRSVFCLVREARFLVGPGDLEHP